MKDPIGIKVLLYTKCQEYVQQRMDTAKNAMDAAQASANEESKSSAGDKYETGRSMMQLEKEMAGKQFLEAVKLKNELDLIDPQKTYLSVLPGSLVKTNQGTYFISTSVGKVSLEKTDYFAISSSSPIGQQLLNKKTGEAFTFNNKTIQIEAIY
jgi:transcription elongation GreA/GreB family factor